ncbi:MAG TPA: AAA family ATPase [Mycobacterium sp.]|nr:AAA family ATPase [Mycobacterium sp.]
MPATANRVGESWTIAGNLDAQVRETHTGLVVLLGDKAYKAKKPVSTDFLDFSTPARRRRACEREVVLNSRLSPNSYLGVADFTGAHGGPPEPVIVMRRYADGTRLASMIKNGQAIHDHLQAIAETVARFHADASRGRAIDAQATVGAISARWQENLEELVRYPDIVISRQAVKEVQRLASQFISGRASLFAQRITERRIVDGHADLLADDIFCTPDELAILDCLEFDDNLRYVDTIDDAAFLAMDIEFLGREDLANHFLDEYTRCAADPAPLSLKNFYVAYRAVVRAKVDCIRVGQGHEEAAADARRHIDIALKHLRAGTVQLIVVGGGPGTGKTTLSRALAERSGALVISTDDVRREMRRVGAIAGTAGVLDAGLYTTENVSAVYDEVLRRAHLLLSGGRSVILDGTWRDLRQRERARMLAAQTSSAIVEFTCSAPLERASARIENRGVTTSDATPLIAAELADHSDASIDGHLIDTSRPLADSVAEAEQICCLAI